MNRDRRKRLRQAKADLEEATRIVGSVKGSLENIKEAEEEVVSNTPENLQNRDAYSIAENAVDSLDDACTSLDDAVNSIGEAIGKIEEVDGV